jgi:hypothetical protein
MFAFEADCWDSLIPIENRFALRKVFRQSDATFITILENMRKGEVTLEHEAILRERDQSVTYADRINPVQL